jgi:hypothetical protein
MQRVCRNPGVRVRPPCPTPLPSATGSVPDIILSAIQNLQIHNLLFQSPDPFRTRVIFRVGDADARNLATGLSFFEARDLQNLETGEAICRVEKADGDFNLTIPLSEDPSAEQAEATRQAVVNASRAK